MGCHLPRFNNDPAPNSTAVNTAARESTSTVLETVKLQATEVVQSFMIDMWLARQTPEKVVPLLQKVIRAASDLFADAVSNGGGVYAVGYCFGGKYVLSLASDVPATVAAGETVKDEEEGMVKGGPLVKCGALAHATSVTQQDFVSVKSPVSLVCVENDQLFPEEHLLAGIKMLEEKGVEHENKTYKGVPHGKRQTSGVCFCEVQANQR